MLNALMNSPIVWAILAICTIVGLPSFVYTIVSRKKIEISFARSYNRLVKKGVSSVSDLTLLFKGKEISDLTITKFAIWNSGNTVINKVDIAEARKLSMTGNRDAHILEASITDITEESNNSTLLFPKPDTVEIDFDYYDRRDGIVIQVLHTGNSDNIRIDGIIKGGNKIKEYSDNMHYFRAVMLFSAHIGKIAIPMLVCFAVLFGLCSVLFLFGRLGFISQELFKQALYYSDSKSNLNYDLSVLMILSIFMFATTIMSLYNMLKNVIKIGIPSKLKSYTIIK